jgi:hypothetical protein
MRAAALAMVAALLLLSAANGARADENNDLDLIPGAARQDQGPPPAPGANPAGEAPPTGSPAAAPPPAAATSAPGGKFYVEDAATAWSLRRLVVPQPGGIADWQNRTSFDATYEWHALPDLTANFSDRFNLLEESDFDFPSHHTFRNDFREAYVSWEPVAQTYVEAGRINVKSGVALGFNPTDFFKTRTLVDQASLDPSVIREDRLGTAMVRAQRIWDGGSVSASFAPKLVSPAPIDFTTYPSIDPGFNRTNADDRLLLTGNLELGHDISPEFLFYHEGSQTRFGADISRSVSDAIVAYAEWAGGRQLDVTDAAFDFGKDTGALPVTVPTVGNVAFRNDAAVGFSWTSAAKVTVNVEYHYHQAGFSEDQWRNWFGLGAPNPTSQQITGTLWYVRGYAADQQEPITQHEMFLRADWTDAFITNLELSAFSFVDLYDGSTLSQISASYYLSDRWTMSGFVSANLGSPRSERGSSPQAESMILQLVRYF